MRRQFGAGIVVLFVLASASCASPRDQVVQPDLEAATQSTVATTVSNCDESTTDPKLEGASYASPDDREVTTEIGPIKISTTSPVTFTDLENGTYMHFLLSNSSSQSVAVRIPDVQKLEASRPPWIIHMSVIRDSQLTREGALEMTVPASGSTTLDVYSSRDAGPGIFEATWTPEFELPASGGKTSLPISLRSVQGEFGPDAKRIPESASVSGRVFGSDGEPLANAEITAFLSSGQLRRYVKSDFYGKFALPLISDVGIRQLSGGRQLSPPAEWNLTVEAKGTNLWSSGPFTLAQGEVRKCKIYLSNVEAWNYQIKATIESPNGYGAWDSHFFGNGDRLVVAPNIHGPGDAIAPIAIRAYDLLGNELWSVPIDSVRDYGVWQMSVSPDGKFIAATSNDGFLRVISDTGTVVHKQKIFMGQNAAAATQFSPDGSKLATSSDNGIIVLDTSSWTPVWESNSDMYRGFWSDTEAGLVAGSIDGLITSFASDGTVRWRRGAGYGPLNVFVDSSGRVTAAGKARKMRSWDANGVPLWSYELAHTSNRTSLRHGASTTGDLILAPTFNGLDEAFDATGRLLWMRWLPVQEEPDPAGGTMLRVPGPGHAGTYVASDGSFIVQGTRGNQVIVLGRDGSQLWKSEVFPTKPGYPDGGHYNPGANTVLATPDGKYVIAGFADAVIRIFERS